MAIKGKLPPIIADRFGPSPATKKVTPGPSRASTWGAGVNLRGAGSTQQKAQDVLDMISGTKTVGKNQQGPLKSGYVTAAQAQKRTVPIIPGTKPIFDSPAPVVKKDGSLQPNPGVNAGGAGGAGGATPSQTSGTSEGTAEAAAPTVDPQALLSAAIARLLEGDFIGFQGERASELRRLQNLRNQLFGTTLTDPVTGQKITTTGTFQRQQGLDEQARRRLAAGRAVAGMLQGGAYAGLERGLGTIQRAEQDYGLREMLRPYEEQVQAPRLTEFGLTYDPTSREFDLANFGDDALGKWSTSTFGGREAAARARAAAIQQLAQQGIQI